MIIFLDDVNEKNGPTAMVPNSNKNKKLFNYYSSVWSEPSLNEKENYLKNYLGPETFKEVVNEKTTKYLKKEISFLLIAPIFIGHQTYLKGKEKFVGFIFS